MFNFVEGNDFFLSDYINGKIEGGLLFGVALYSGIFTEAGSYKNTVSWPGQCASRTLPDACRSALYVGIYCTLDVQIFEPVSTSCEIKEHCIQIGHYHFLWHPFQPSTLM
jgi:hypothetical protein